MTLGTSDSPIPLQEDIGAPANPSLRRNYRLFFALAGTLVLLFSKPLWDLLRFALKTELFSHVILIPCISFYFIWQNRRKLPQPEFGNIGFASVLAIPGIIATLLAFNPSFATSMSVADRLSLSTLGFVFFFYSVSMATLGFAWVRSSLFPLLFLLFAIPFPDALTNFLETASQQASADTYAWMMNLTGVTYFREGFVFSLPGLNLRVAQECSGIRSSVVLFIVSIIAGQMFLRSNWKRLIFALCVIPLGVARNGFRIYTLSMLTVHWDPGIIDGPLHHQGGPVFFALSLLPFFALLLLLWRMENRKVNKGVELQ